MIHWDLKHEIWAIAWYKAGCPIKHTITYGSITLDARTMAASRGNADAFISIHENQTR